jgi:hypothetical protein
MIVYNVTINVQGDTVDEWVKWMREIHLPEVMQTGMFEKYSMFRLLTRQEDEDGVTFCVQYASASMHNYDRYITEFAPALRDKAEKQFGGKFHAFRTVMEEV